jgi:hypothetical protein
MLADRKNRGQPGFVPKHTTQIREDRFWLNPQNEVDLISHANISRQDLLAENQKCWDKFYSVKEVLKRVQRGRPGGWPLAGKFTYLLLCLAFRRIYGGQGMAADGVRRGRLGTITRTLIRIGVATYNRYFRRQLDGKVGRPLAGSARPFS